MTHVPQSRTILIICLAQILTLAACHPEPSASPSHVADSTVRPLVAVGSLANLNNRETVGFDALRGPSRRRADQQPVVVDTVKHEGAAYVVARISPSSVDVRLHLLNQNGRPHGSVRRFVQANVARGEVVLFAMNAGIFEDRITPTGLHVERGHVIQPVNLRTRLPGNFYAQPNGVFWIGRDGAVRLDRSQVAATQIPHMQEATQSGPVLVENGRINPAIASWTRRTTRNGVGVCENGTVVLAISLDIVSVPSFARMFLAQKCSSALYLDGYYSTMALPNGAILGRDGRATGILAVVPRRAAAP